MRARLPTIPLRVASLDARSVKPPPKTADPLYRCSSYREWAELVITRAGGRCEAIVDGHRCIKAKPRHRVFADHKHEVRDGGARFDPMNGQCLCGSHHTSKTAQARAHRR